MRHLRARTPVRGLALVVLAVLVAGFLAAFTYARRAVADQEGRLLKQRAGEAGGGEAFGVAGIPRHQVIHAARVYQRRILRR